MRERIIDKVIPWGASTQPIKIDHILDVVDDEHQYTGCYQVTLGSAMTATIEFKEGVWIESGNGPTDLSKKAGELIDQYAE